jgi:hypothetical protein
MWLLTPGIYSRGHGRLCDVCYIIVYWQRQRVVRGGRVACQPVHCMYLVWNAQHSAPMQPLSRGLCDDQTCDMMCDPQVMLVPATKTTSDGL